MTDLPPAVRLAKLHALEEWLAWQLDSTRRKIQVLEQEERDAVGYVVEQPIREGHPRGATVHRGDCKQVERQTRSATPDEARFVLEKDPSMFKPCEFCQPDQALGLAGG